MIQFIYIVLVICNRHTFALIDVGLIKNYFSFKYVSYGSVFTCYSNQEQITLAKSLMVSNISLTMYNINDRTFNINSSNLFMKNNGRLGIVLDGDCSSSKDFLKKCSDLKVFTDVHYWIVFLKKDIIVGLFNEIVLTISTDLKVAIPANASTINTIWNLYDVYNQAGDHGGELKVLSYNNYTRSGLIKHWKPKESLYWMRRNMTGVNFKTMVVLPKNYSETLEEYLISDDHREINTFNRFHTVLVYHMRDFYNFSITMSEDTSWGYKLPNGSFDGLVRALELKEVDFGASPLFVKDERWPVVDYGRRTWLLRSAFIFRMPKKPASFEVFLRPLHGDVWYVTGLALIVIVICLRVAYKTEFRFIKIYIIDSFEGTWSFLVLFTLGALCQQGAADTPHSVSSRILVIFTFIFAVLLYQFYSASIVAILLMTPTKFIKNLDNLAQSNLKLGMEDTLYNKDYLKKLEFDPVISLLHKKAPKKGNISFYCDPEVALPLVAKGGYAFHVEVATAYPIIEKTFDDDTICSLDEVQLFQTQQMHQALQKNSPFREMLNYILQRIDEAGLMRRQLKHWNSRKPECLRTKPPTSSVSIEEFYPALSVLLIGMCISFIILAVEFIIKAKLERQEAEQRKEVPVNVNPWEFRL